MTSNQTNKVVLSESQLPDKSVDMSKYYFVTTRCGNCQQTSRLRIFKGVLKKDVEFQCSGCDCVSEVE